MPSGCEVCNFLGLYAACFAAATLWAGLAAPALWVLRCLREPRFDRAVPPDAGVPSTRHAARAVADLPADGEREQGRGLVAQLRLGVGIAHAAKNPALPGRAFQDNELPLFYTPK
jgi:hypothetical protein